MRGDPGSHRAYGRGTSLTLINEVKKKCCNVRLGQFSDYLSKNSCIFVLKLRRFDEGVTAQMCSIITGCSGTIVVNLAIHYKKIEKQWGQ